MRTAANLACWTCWALLVALVSLVVGLAWLRPPTHQPLSFNHAKHAAMACVVCHRGVETAVWAGIPDIDTCLNCHLTPPVKIAAEVDAWTAAARTKHIAWQTLTRLPDHVYFSHHRHVTLSQLECATCHGDLATRSTPPPRPLRPVSMDRCLECHRQQQASLDCARCHK